LETELLRHLKARPILFICILIGAVLFFAVPFENDHAARWLLAWDISAAAYLVMAGYKMTRATEQSMQARAEEVDEGRYGYLVLSVIAAVASLAAIVVELVKLNESNGHNPNALFYVLVALATIVLSWAFIQVVFTEHYAHEYYMTGSGEDRTSNREGGGIKFLGHERPNYVDFLYFTVTIGVANQTADIGIVSRQMRLLVLIQSVISYFFNTTILALSINIAASFL
jgi:uncharacterized membrane protein